MCTVSLINAGDMLRLACNRDETITRPDALPPRVTQAGNQTVIMPRDPKGGGTWIATSSAGLVFTILNLNPTPGVVHAGGASRGTIIPSLVDAPHLGAVCEQIRRSTFSPYAPFQLLVADREAWLQVRWDRRWLRVSRSEWTGRPLMLTSSGLGDALVDSPRRRLFESMVVNAANRSIAQDQFHAHQWSDAPWLSIRMERAEARTVSRTVVEITPDSVSMDYRCVKESTPKRIRFSRGSEVTR